MAKRPLFIRTILLLALPALLVLGGCDAFSSNDDDDDHDDHEEELARVELETRDGTPETVAVWTHDDGWNVDALPPLQLGGDYGVWTVRMFAEDGDELELEEDGEYEARYAVADDAPQNVIYFDDSGAVKVDGEEEELFHGDHIHVYPQSADTTRIRILLWHDSHSDASTDFIDLIVRESGTNEEAFMTPARIGHSR